MSSAFLQTSVYHWAKSTSRAVMASTCLLSCAIASIPLPLYHVACMRFSLVSYCSESGGTCQGGTWNLPFQISAAERRFTQLLVRTSKVGSHPSMDDCPYDLSHLAIIKTQAQAEQDNGQNIAPACQYQNGLFCVSVKKSIHFSAECDQ